MTAIPAASTTPDGVTIAPRNRKFDLEAALAGDWFGGDPFLTALFNALSLSFPSGEKEFIDSVRHFEDRISDEKLLMEIRGFYQQEGIHSREHRRYNEQLCQARGYDLDALEGVYLRMIETAKAHKRVTPEVKLASTVGSEHFTAGFAEILLKSTYLDDAEPTIRDLWLWHSVEEMEHKSVAYDVYMQVAGSQKMRKRVMRLTMFMMLKSTLTVTAKILRHDKQLWKWSTLKSATRFFFGKTGFMHQYMPHHKEFYRDDFHPWDADTRDLLEQWKPKLAA